MARNRVAPPPPVASAPAPAPAPVPQPLPAAAPTPATPSPRSSIVELLESMRTAFDTAISVAMAPSNVYHVVVIPEAGAAVVHTCLDGASAAGLIRPLLAEQDAEYQFFVFSGSRVAITKHPGYLLTSEGRFPLFTEKDLSDTLAEDGYIREPSLIVNPDLALPPATAPAETTEESDTEESSPMTEDDDLPS